MARTLGITLLLAIVLSSFAGLVENGRKRWWSQFRGPSSSGVGRERLAQRTDLRLYTTEIVVDDLEELRQALGYGPINLYGTSYGSRVAQVYMRRYPKSLCAVAMKGIVPPSMAIPASHARAGEDAWAGARGAMRERSRLRARVSYAGCRLQAAAHAAGEDIAHAHVSGKRENG